MLAGFSGFTKETARQREKAPYGRDKGPMLPSDKKEVHQIREDMLGGIDSLAGRGYYTGLIGLAHGLLS